MKIGLLCAKDTSKHAAYGWLIDFNGMSTHEGLYQEFFFLIFTVLSNKNFLSISTWPIDGTLIPPTPLGQSGPGNKGKEEVLHTH